MRHYCRIHSESVKHCNKERFDKEQIGTGKSLSEALILASTNPQYDSKLFNDLQVQYKKIPKAEHVKNVSRTCYLHKLF